LDDKDPANRLEKNPFVFNGRTPAIQTFSKLFPNISLGGSPDIKGLRAEKIGIVIPEVLRFPIGVRGRRGGDRNWFRRLDSQARVLVSAIAERQSPCIARIVFFRKRLL
jgi:hypothetical protein